MQPIVASPVGVHAVDLVEERLDRGTMVGRHPGSQQRMPRSRSTGDGGLVCNGTESVE